MEDNRTVKFAVVFMLHPLKSKHNAGLINVYHVVVISNVRSSNGIKLSTKWGKKSLT